MSMSKKSKINYLKAIVIAHGKSEVQLCNFIKSNLRLKIHVEADKNGEKSIQITSILTWLNSTNFKTKTAFLKKFEDINLIDKKKKIISSDFKVFIIMDTDDCSPKQKKDFISKIMFKGHWLYEYIHPIFNSSNLEEVLINAGIHFEKKGKKCKEEYIKIFPTDKKFLGKEKLSIEELLKKLKLNEKTNMEEFFEFCLKS